VADTKVANRQKRVESLLLSQRLFWGRRLCGAKSKELGPTALKQLLIFTRHYSRRLFPKILECRSQKTFNPSRLSFYSYFWDTTLANMFQKTTPSNLILIYPMKLSPGLSRNGLRVNRYHNFGMQNWEQTLKRLFFGLFE
jgi:hypothetical protein